MKTLLSFFGLLAWLTTGAFGATWYIDNTATNGLNNGTSWANAWVSLNNIVGPPYPSSNDIVYISGGPIGTTRILTNVSINYSPVGFNLQIAQDTNHCGTIIFDGTTVGNFWLKEATGCSYSGNYNGSNHFIVTNYVAGGAYADVVGDGSSGVTLDHITFYDTVSYNGATNIVLSYDTIYPIGNGTDHAIFWNVTAPTGNGTYTNNQIHNCYISPPRQQGLNTNGGNGADCIQDGAYSSVYSNYFSPHFITNYTGTQHEDGWQPPGNNCAIYDNLFENIPGYCIYGEFASAQANILVYNNIFRVTGGTTNSLGLGVYLGYANVGQTNLQPYLFSNICVFNNTFVDCTGGGQGAFALGQTGTTNNYTNCYCLNNLVYDCGYYTGTNVSAFAATAWNNAVGYGVNSCTNGQVISYNYFQAGLSGNILFNIGTNTQFYFPPTGYVMFNTYTQFSTGNDFHLAYGDTAVTKQGTNLTSLFASLGITANDYDGVARPATGNWDIGAYQNVAVATNSPIIINFTGTITIQSN